MGNYNLSMSAEEKAVYDLLCDDKSKQVFLARKILTEFGDSEPLRNLFEKPDGFDEFIDIIRNHKYVIYGGGFLCSKFIRIFQTFGAERNLVEIWDKKGNELRGKFGDIPVRKYPEKRDFSEFDYIVVAVSPKKNKKVFDEVLNLLADIGIPSDMILTPYFQLFGLETTYFPPDIIQFQDDEIFIDGGCFDFYTSANFIRKCSSAGKSVKKVYAFEPDEKLAIVSKENSKQYPFAEIVTAGLYSKSTTICFHVSNIERSSFIDENGNQELKVVALDQFIPQNDRVTFVKMDVEGAELEALRGMKNIIQRDMPKLAISIYHKPKDYVEIPMYIKILLNIAGQNNNCSPQVLHEAPQPMKRYEIIRRMYMRHHSINTDDTILYCVP